MWLPNVLPDVKDFSAVGQSFDGLDRRMVRWLDCEQTINERLINHVFEPVHHHNNTVQPTLRPEGRPVWDQEVVWLPRKLVRCYGAVEAEIRAAFGVTPPKGHAPLLVHAQPPASHRRLIREFGAQRLPGVLATPTASYRSVVAWRPGGKRTPVVLKLSIGALIGARRRAFRENQIARAILISSLFDTIPMADRQRLRFDWFSETAGVIDQRSGHGWLLRHLPHFMSKPGRRTVMPVFSLISRRGDQPPHLVTLIRRSRQKPEAFVIERLLKPYVDALAYLLFEQGLQYEGHSQNVLVEIGARDELTGRYVLRDLADTTVNVAFRVAKGKTLPRFPRDFLPPGSPFPVAGNAADYRCGFAGNRTHRGLMTVERYGLGGFVWPINTSLARYFKGYDAPRVEHRYLELWQQATIDYLRFRPLFRHNGKNQPKGLATDETVAHVLRLVDWRALGATPARLDDAAEPLLIVGKMRRRSGPVYERLECAWGDLYMCNGLPGFFRPAF
jgi:hypothetical protein